jgi:cation diffusion facilitator family transporter
MVSLTVGVAVLITKYVAYFLTGSAAIFSDATESIANVLAAIVAIVSLGVAHLPADEHHPYGHGKAEFLSAWFEGSMILLAGVFIIIKTADAVWRGEYLRPGDAGVGIVVLAAASAVNLLVGVYLVRAGRRYNSLVLEADGRHLLSDVYTSAGVLVALGLVKLTGRAWLDPLCAFLMAGWIIWLASGLLRRAAAGLMDRQDVEDDLIIQRILDSHCGEQGKPPRICNYHKLRHRHSGRYHWVDFHIRLPAEVNVQRAHAIASAIEEEIEAAVGEGNATAHVEPCGGDQCRPDGSCHMKPI